MRCGTLLRFGLNLGMCVVGSAAVCLGGSVKATQDNPDPTVFSTGGFMNVAAYSDEQGFGQNLTVTSNVVFGGVPQTAPGQYKTGVGLTSQTIFVPNGQMKLNLSGTKMIPDGSFLGPVAQNTSTTGLAFSKSRLSAVGDVDSITSQTAGWIGMGSVTNTSVPGRGKYTVSASALAGEFVGRSAGLAGDPIDIPSGSYPYDPNINVTVDIDPGEAGDARVYAVDGSTFTGDNVENYQADGEPLQNALWSLVMGGTSPSSSTANVDVDFELNPAALNEITFPSSYLAGLGSYSNQTQEAQLIDQSMDNTIMSDETFAANVDTLTNVDPFPSGTMFSPMTNGEAYNDGVDAAIEAPEPGTLSLLAAGAALCLRRRGRVTRTAGE